MKTQTEKTWRQLKAIVGYTLWHKSVDPTLLSRRIDWAALYDLAASQTIHGLFVDGAHQFISSVDLGERFSLFNLPDEDMVMDWGSAQMLLQRRNILMGKALRKMTDILKEAQIHFVVVKGQVCGNRWPEPLHRVPGDIDLMIMPEDHTQAQQVFERMGAEKVKGAEFKHATYALGDISWELHFMLHRFGQSRLQSCFDSWVHQSLYAPMAGTIVYSDDKSKSTEVPVLAPEMEVVHLLLHFVHHVIHEGCGMRQLIDFALVLHRGLPKLNQNLLLSRIHILQLDRAFRTMVYLAEQVVGMPRCKLFPSFSASEICLAKRIEKRMMTDGNFGHNTGWIKPAGLWGSVCYNLRSFHRELMFLPLWPKEAMLFPWEVISRKL